MVMLKVIHATLTHGTQVLHVSDDSINDTSIIEVYTDNILVYPEQIAQSGTTLDITFGLYAFDVDCAILVDNTTSFEVVDNLVSTSVSNALSANQGKELNDLIDALTYAINTLELSNLADVRISNITDGQILKWDANTNKFVNANEIGGGGEIIYPLDSTPVKIGKVGNHDLYRQYYHGNTGNSEQVVIGTLPNNAKMINACGYVDASESGLIWVLSDYLSNYWNFGIHIDSSNNNIIISNGLNVRNKPFEMWVDYYVVSEV